MTPHSHDAKPSTAVARLWRRLKTALSAPAGRGGRLVPPHE